MVVGGGGHFPSLDQARGQTPGGTGLSDNPHSGKALQGGEQGQGEWGAVRLRGVWGRVSLQARVGCGGRGGVLWLGSQTEGQAWYHCHSLIIPRASREGLLPSSQKSGHRVLSQRLSPVGAISAAEAKAYSAKSIWENLLGPKSVSFYSRKTRQFLQCFMLGTVLFPLQLLTNSIILTTRRPM